MTVRQNSWTYVGLLALVGLFCGAERTAQGQGPPPVLGEEQVNHVVGPDTIQGNADDDDPADQPHIKGQNETTIACIREADGWPQKIFGAWNDDSWRDDANAFSVETSIGFGVSANAGGG